MSIEATGATAPRVSKSSTATHVLHVFLTRGLVAIVWAVVFAVVADSSTTGVTVDAGILLVIFPLIDLVATLIDARSQHGSARRPLLANAAVSAVAAVALGVAATGTVADVFAVFGAWALITGAAQLVVVLRRRAQLGKWSVSRRLICRGALPERVRTAHFVSRSEAGPRRRTYATASRKNGSGVASAYGQGEQAIVDWIGAVPRTAIGSWAFRHGPAAGARAARMRLAG